MAHEYVYPKVTEITQPRIASPDNFLDEPQMELTNADDYRLSLRHYGRIMEHYEERRENAARNLAKFSLLYSGQLSFDFEEVDGTPE
jgi:glycyl-tRNA synthetase beta subunit